METAQKNQEKREAIGLVPLAIVQYLLALGPALIGQRMKNKVEFWGGLALFPIMLYAIFTGVAWLSGIIAILSWIYVVGRLCWIAFRKENEIKII